MFLKFLFDKISSVLGLLLLLPVLLLIAIVVKINMPDGPIIFRQKRIGLRGVTFTIFKFRTMTASHSGSVVSVKGEARITPLGAKLRKYKLDELPELFNVLIGDMSFVGPRPDVEGYADKLIGDDKKVLLLKPGITGPASLKYRNEEELLSKQLDPIEYNNSVVFPDKVKINLKYLEHWSLFKDIKIIIYTILNKDLECYY